MLSISHVDICSEHENVQENVKTMKRDVTSNGDLSKLQSKSNMQTNLRKPTQMLMIFKELQVTPLLNQIQMMVILIKINIAYWPSLWCVSRVKTIGENWWKNGREGDSEDSSKVNDLRIGKHNIIILTGALLLEPSTVQNHRQQEFLSFFISLLMMARCMRSVRWKKVHMRAGHIAYHKESYNIKIAYYLNGQIRLFEGKHPWGRKFEWPSLNKIRNHNTRHSVRSRTFPHYLLPFRAKSDRTQFRKTIK